MHHADHFMQARLGQHKTSMQRAAASSSCREVRIMHTSCVVCSRPHNYGHDMDMTSTQTAGATGKGVRAPGMSSGGQSCVEQRDHSQGPPCLTSESCWQNPSPRQHLGHHPAAITSAIISQHNVSRLMRPKCNKEEYQHFQPVKVCTYQIHLSRRWQ